MRYANYRAENNIDFIPEDVIGKYDIPVIRPVPYNFMQWIPFNYANSFSHRENVGVHFFIDDYQFSRIWFYRKKFEQMFSQFKATMTPDFSLYTDYPIALQIYNHWRKHMLGAWMQSIGCNVYPTIAWSDERSYAWCFDGEPHKSTVCVSSVGTQKSKESTRLFLRGYDQMMNVLEPTTILFYGKIPSECTGNIVKIEPFYMKFRGGKNDDKN